MDFCNAISTVPYSMDTVLRDIFHALATVALVILRLWILSLRAIVTLWLLFLRVIFRLWILSLGALVTLWLQVL